MSKKYALVLLNTDKSLGLALALLAVIAFSLTLPMTRIAVVDLGALSVAIWRALIAGFAALVLLLLLRPMRPKGCQWWQIIVCAFGTVFGFPVFTITPLPTCVVEPILTPSTYIYISPVLPSHVPVI